MKILHISNSLRGGANKAMLRHHKALLAAGYNSVIVIGEEPSGTLPDHVFSLNNVIRTNCSDNSSLDNKMRCFAESDLAKSADIIEFRLLHNGHGRDVFHLDLLKYLSHKNIIWRLSDMWPFTGFCAYSFDCSKWETSCGSDCPQLGDAAANIREIRIPDAPLEEVFRAKKEAYRAVAKNMHIVCPSKWIMALALRSILSDSAEFVHIPVGIDTSVFHPMDKKALRAKHGIAQDANVLISCIANLRNHRKASDLLWTVLRTLPGKVPDLKVLIIGGREGELPADVAEKLSVLHVPFVDNETEQAEYFAMSDVHCFTSRYDNSAQTLAEAMSCGLPTVSFDVGGNGEYVINNRSGILVSPYKTDIMANELAGLLNDKAKLSDYSMYAASHCREVCGIGQQTEKFIKLYNQMVQAPE